MEGEEEEGTMGGYSILFRGEGAKIFEQKIEKEEQKIEKRNKIN